MFEKVNPNHPDKVADRIAGALVDLAYANQENPKVAVEVLLGHGECTIYVHTAAHVDIVPGDRTAVHSEAASEIYINTAAL